MAVRPTGDPTAAAKLQVIEPRRSKSKRRPILIGITIVVVAMIGFLFLRSRNSATGETSYRVTAAQIGVVRKTVSATGTLQPWATVDIKSKAGGRVNELDVDIGSVVKAGQIIAKIDPTDSLLTFEQASADTDSAKAKESQGGAAYQLQVAQSQSGILGARASLTVARANLSAANARLQSARELYAAQPGQTAANVAQAQANYDSAVQGRAQLSQTQSQDRVAAQSAYDQASANDRNAQLNLTRLKSLLELGFVAGAEVDQAQANAGVTMAALATAKNKLDTLGNEQKAVAASEDAKVRQALEQLKSAKAQIDVKIRLSAVNEAIAAKNQSAAQVTQAQAQLAQAESDVINNQIKAYDIAGARASALRAKASLANAKATLDQTVVRAPSAGIILQKYVEPGTIITSGLSLNSTGASIVQIGDVSKMYVYVLVDETDIGSVKVGQHVDISLDAYPGTPFSGIVSRIDPQAQVQQNVTSVGVRIEIDNTNESFSLLKPNLNATCEFIVEEKTKVLMVPSEAVQTDENGSFVQVAHAQAPTGKSRSAGKAKRAQATLKNVKVERRPVEIGFRGDESVEIVSGLKEGEVVVLQTITASAAPAAAQARGAVGGMGGRGGR